jgi:2-amino-4-hydroxy-6-hydroxymethyldihydropteridine diphosphokinase
MVDCYVGMGGNFLSTLSAMRQAATELKATQGLKQLAFSRVYQTKPVSSLLQPPYLNAVCRFQTELSIENVWNMLTAIESRLGKKPKPKDSPRLIDLDLLFYGPLVKMTADLIIPHPRWHERLFVLAPLADVTQAIPIENISIEELVARFKNPHQETISLFSKQWEEHADS